MATAVGTETIEEEMPDADDAERRKDEDTGKVQTFAEVLTLHRGDTDLAETAWDLMSAVSRTPRGLTQQFREQTLNSQDEQLEARRTAHMEKAAAQQAASKGGGAQQTAAQQQAGAQKVAATNLIDVEADEGDAAAKPTFPSSEGKPEPSAAEILASADAAAARAAEKAAGQADTSARHASAMARSAPAVLKLGQHADQRLARAKNKMAKTSLSDAERVQLMEIFGEDLNKSELQLRKEVVNELKIYRDRVNAEDDKEQAIEQHKEDAAAQGGRRDGGEAQGDDG